MCRAEVHRIILLVIAGCLVFTGMLVTAAGAEEVGALGVTSVPPGASVYVDGTYMGKTPIDDLTITVGQHTLRVSLAGYNDEVRTFTITAGSGPYIHVDLTPATGSLTLNTIPSGATLILDGVNRGTTPLTLTGLSPGTHTARFSLSGYQEDTETVTVVAGGSGGGYTFTLSPVVQVPTTGGLALNTIPSGATVVIDGVNRGTTPVTVTGLSPGPHTVRFSLAGYQEDTETLPVTAGQTVGYTFTLSPAAQAPTTGGLILNTVPPGATVVLDDVVKGTTPLDITGLAPGSQTLRFSLSGYQEDTETLPVTAGQTVGYTFTLSPVAQAPTTGGLTLNTVPSGATVVLDGVVKGTTPLDITGITPGQHTIRLSLSGYEEESQTVSVLGGQASTYRVPLAALTGSEPTAPLVSDLQPAPSSSESFLDIIFNFFAKLFGGNAKSEPSTIPKNQRYSVSPCANNGVESDLPDTGDCLQKCVKGTCVSQPIGEEVKPSIEDLRQWLIVHPDELDKWAVNPRDVIRESGISITDSQADALAKMSSHKLLGGYDTFSQTEKASLISGSGTSPSGFVAPVATQAMEVCTEVCTPIPGTCDGVPDACDNCRFKKNPGQADTDGDCSLLAQNPALYDAQSAGWLQDPQCGDACDRCPGINNHGIDKDKDGYDAACDTCWEKAYLDTETFEFNNKDGDGDCESRKALARFWDADEKRWIADPRCGDICDSCPNVPNTWTDSDSDGVDDACDQCKGIPDSRMDICWDCRDGDGNGVADCLDYCPTLGSQVYVNDKDGDRVPDTCDRCPGIDDFSLLMPDGETCDDCGDMDGDGKANCIDLGGLNGRCRTGNLGGTPCDDPYGCMDGKCSCCPGNAIPVSGICAQLPSSPIRQPDLLPSTDEMGCMDTKQMNGLASDSDHYYWIMLENIYRVSSSQGICGSCFCGKICYNADDLKEGKYTEICRYPQIDSAGKIVDTMGCGAQCGFREADIFISSNCECLDHTNVLAQASLPGVLKDAGYNHFSDGDYVWNGKYLYVPVTGPGPAAILVYDSDLNLRYWGHLSEEGPGGAWLAINERDGMLYTSVGQGSTFGTIHIYDPTIEQSPTTGLGLRPYVPGDISSFQNAQLPYKGSVELKFATPHTEQWWNGAWVQGGDFDDQGILYYVLDHSAEKNSPDTGIHVFNFPMYGDTKCGQRVAQEIPSLFMQLQYDPCFKGWRGSDNRCPDQIEDLPTEYVLPPIPQLREKLSSMIGEFEYLRGDELEGVDVFRPYRSGESDYVNVLLTKATADYPGFDWEVAVHWWKIPSQEVITGDQHLHGVTE